MKQKMTFEEFIDQQIQYCESRQLKFKKENLLYLFDMMLEIGSNENYQINYEEKTITIISK